MDIAEVAGSPHSARTQLQVPEVAARIAEATELLAEPLAALGWPEPKHHFTFQDVTGVYLHVGQGAADSVGYRADELVGRNCYNFFHPDEFAAIVEIHKDRLATDQPILGRLHFMARNERYVPLQFLSSPLACQERPLFATLFGPRPGLIEAPSYQVWDGNGFGPNVMPDMK